MTVASAIRADPLVSYLKENGVTPPEKTEHIWVQPWMQRRQMRSLTPRLNDREERVNYRIRLPGAIAANRFLH